MKTKMTDNFSTDAMLVMIGLCKLMAKHGIKPSLSKGQHVGVTKNGVDNIRRAIKCTGKESGRPGLNTLQMLANKFVRCRIPVWQLRGRFQMHQRTLLKETSIEQRE